METRLLELIASEVMSMNDYLSLQNLLVLELLKGSRRFDTYMGLHRTVTEALTEKRTDFIRRGQEHDGQAFQGEAAPIQESS